jgi:hypothetical protein
VQGITTVQFPAKVYRTSKTGKKTVIMAGRILFGVAAVVLKQVVKEDLYILMSCEEDMQPSGFDNSSTTLSSPSVAQRSRWICFFKQYENGCPILCEVKGGKATAAEQRDYPQCAAVSEVTRLGVDAFKYANGDRVRKLRETELTAS